MTTLTAPFFSSIRYTRGGVDAMMTATGLVVGSTPNGALFLATLIKGNHTFRLYQKAGRMRSLITVPMLSLISVPMLSIQVWLHAAAYVGCVERTPIFLVGGFLMSQPASTLAGIIADRYCPAIETHANPINAEWSHVGVFWPKSQILD